MTGRRAPSAQLISAARAAQMMKRSADTLKRRRREGQAPHGWIVRPDEFGRPRVYYPLAAVRAWCAAVGEPADDAEATG